MHTVIDNSEVSSIQSDWINMWIEQNMNSIRDNMEALSDSDGIKDYLFKLVQNAYEYIRKNEKELVKQKQADGIRIAQENGIHFGRSKMEKPAEFYPLYFRYKNGELSARNCGKKLNVSHSTFLKWIKECDESLE